MLRTPAPAPLAPLAALVLAALTIPPVAAQGRSEAPAGVTDPAEIDRAVQAFTGAAIGEAGGALAPADQRLRLAACAQALTTSWHGTARAAVRVECQSTPGPSGPWRIFVATRPASDSPPGNSPRARSAPASPAVKRGDPVTVVVRGRGFSVQQAGEATESGQPGDWIAVRTSRKAEPVRARIERPGLVVIPVG